MSLEVSAPQLQGQLSEPLFHIQEPKPQGPAVQLLLWQVLQQLQSLNPNGNQCMMLVDELRTERTRLRQERARHEDFEEDAYKEITQLRNEKKLSTIHSDSLMLELHVKKSRLETLEKQLLEDRSSRVKVEVEVEKCKEKLMEEQELNTFLGQELGKEKEEIQMTREENKFLKDQVRKLTDELNDEKLSGMNSERELEKDKKYIHQLEETLKNETIKRISEEHEHLKHVLELKNNISLLSGFQDMTENSKKMCDNIRLNLDDERSKVSNLKDELSDLRINLFKLNIELGYEQKFVAELREGLNKEINESRLLKNELDFENKKVITLEKELKILRKQFEEEKLEKEDLEKKLLVGQFDLNSNLNKVKKLSEDLNNEILKVQELERRLNVVNGTDHELQVQNEAMEQKLEIITQELNKERNKTIVLKDKLENAAKETGDLKKKLENEKDISNEEKERRKSAEKELKVVQHLYVKCGDNEGFTPLHRACKVCDVSEAKLLMKSGYSPTEATKHNGTWSTSVHLAVEAGCTELVQWLVQNSTLLNVWDENGATPLHTAARHPHLNVVRTLLDSGAPVNAWDKFGKTALDYAGSNSNSEIMKVLIDRGAVLGSARKFGSTTEKPDKDDDSDVDYNYYYLETQ